MQRMSKVGRGVAREGTKYPLGSGGDACVMPKLKGFPLGSGAGPREMLKFEMSTTLGQFWLCPWLNENNGTAIEPLTYAVYLGTVLILQYYFTDVYIRSLSLQEPTAASEAYGSSVHEVEMYQKKFGDFRKVCHWLLQGIRLAAI